MWCNSEGGDVVSSIKDDARPSLIPVGSVSDGVGCKCSLCTLNGRCPDPNGELEVRGVPSFWDGETSMGAGADNLSNAVLGKTEEESRPDFWRSAGSLIVGWNR